MIYVALGAGSALAVLLIFGAGIYLGYRLASLLATAKQPERSTAPELTDSERAARASEMETDRAFKTMLTYNIQDVYGMNPEGHFGMRG